MAVAVMTVAMELMNTEGTLIKCNTFAAKEIINWYYITIVVSFIFRPFFRNKKIFIFTTLTFRFVRAGHVLFH